MGLIRVEQIAVFIELELTVLVEADEPVWGVLHLFDLGWLQPLHVLRCGPPLELDKLALGEVDGAL